MTLLRAPTPVAGTGGARISATVSRASVYGTARSVYTAGKCIPRGIHFPREPEKRRDFVTLLGAERVRNGWSRTAKTPQKCIPRQRGSGRRRAAPSRGAHHVCLGAEGSVVHAFYTPGTRLLCRLAPFSCLLLRCGSPCPSCSPCSWSRPTCKRSQRRPNGCGDKKTCAAWRAFRSYGPSGLALDSAGASRAPRGSR